MPHITAGKGNPGHIAPSIKTRGGESVVFGRWRVSMICRIKTQAFRVKDHPAPGFFLRASNHSTHED